MFATLPDAFSHRVMCTQRGGWNSSARILKTFIKYSSKMAFKSQYSSQLSSKYSQIFLNRFKKKYGKRKTTRKYSTNYQEANQLQIMLLNFKPMKQVVKEELESEIRRFKKHADRNRTVPPDFQAGDKVWLASKNIKTTRTTKKLSERWFKPFEVLKKVGSHTYHLKLPLQWKSVHPVFHVSLLKLVKQLGIPNRNQLPPPQILVEEQEEWEVAQVLDSKLKRGKLWYIVEWKGGSEDPEITAWEPASNLTNSSDLVKDFHPLYPDKVGPNTSRV
ncbi:hypothetical protein O181_090687 [Austropuccinia psidii MF-1]|uniref:Chromo domain-containing protein n=1 Tax=Austropuccinia psidii MF-1 TaxID=1389203 RepID=A0A9Q3P7W9_9BASI|nr:hypothetical protein [Austropuccinia psidii MF-1]